MACSSRRSIAWGPMCPSRSITTCCPIWKAFDTVQYRTRPAGNAKPKTPNISGMTFVMICVCWFCAEAGVAFCVCRLE